ncbi:DUF6705 family protein [Lacinutrix mariniflava]|uniref:DUF6705 family protein n=1 Tax=Lacinutrix mariniflava TaxID=342955 RepID=UPI0006E3E2AF|nr:DUF6705 family protein [Lacinutrix mariniflava]
MKNLIILTLTVFTFLSCKAQQPIIALYNGTDYLDTYNAYYKDIDGDLTKIVGTWKYVNGNEVFKLIIKKKEQKLLTPSGRNITFYKDVLYGEYEYIDLNGNEIINTLNEIDSQTDVSENSIYGGYIKGASDNPPCENCEPDERIAKVLIEDPSRTYLFYNMSIRHFPGEISLGTTEQIKIKIDREDYSDIPEGQPDNDRIPLVELTLEKQ